MSPLDFHVLLVLASEDLYGYAIMKRVEEHSAGTLRVEIGTLYRVLSRLADAGLVADAEPPPGAPTSHRGLPRKYYAITQAGSAVVREEARRLERVVRLARNLLPDVSTS